MASIVIVPFSQVNGKNWSSETYCIFSQKEIDDNKFDDYEEVKIFDKFFMDLPDSINNLKKHSIKKMKDSVAKIYYMREFRKNLTYDYINLRDAMAEKQRLLNIYNSF